MGVGTELNPAFYEEDHKEEKKMKKKKKSKLDVELEVAEDQPDKIPPLVGYFPSGFNPLRQQNNDPPSVCVYRNKEKQRRLELVVRPSDRSRVNFVGTSYSGEGACASMCNYALGVLDKETQTLKIIPVAANKIFRLEPKTSSDLSDAALSTPVKKELTNAEMAEKRRGLTNMYGTNKAKKGNQKVMKMRETTNADGQTGLDLDLEDTIDKEALAGADSGSARNIPPHDLSADKPEAAYPLEKIILKGEWDYLLDIWHLRQAGEEITSDQYPTFVRNRIYKLDLIKDELKKKKLTCALSFITHLIKFKDKRSLDGSSSAKQHHIPSILLQRFSAMFGEADKKSKIQVDNIGLLISYVLVLTLIVDDFETIPEDISKDLRINTSSLRTHFETLGCKLVSRSRTVVATLPVPLQFPSTRRRKRKQNR